MCAKALDLPDIYIPPNVMEEKQTASQAALGLMTAHR
jgi:hypothetical protein